MLLVAIGVLALVVAGLAYYVAVQPTPQTVVREQVPAVTPDAAPTVTAAEAPKRNDPVAVAAPIREDEPEEASEPEAADDAAPAVTNERRRRSHPRNRDRRPAGTKPPLETKSTPTKPAPKANPKKTDHLPAECVIDPKGCGLGTPKPEVTKPKEDEEDLPKKLGQGAVRKGLSKVKATAKQCGPRHGVTGQTVQVKLTLRGSTGQVAKATPLKPHAGTALGSCVAAALKKAQFDRFAASVQGVQYGVRL